MVIPIGGGGDPNLGGALFEQQTPELQRRLKRIKLCLIAIILSMIAKLVALILIEPSNAFNAVMSCLNLLLETMIGIFLLKDDRLFGLVHRCMMRTCCAGCGDACQGGISCLCFWFVTCLLFAVSGLLPFGGSDSQTIYVFIRLIANPDLKTDIDFYFPVRSVAWYVVMSTYTAGTTVALLSQVVGAWHGYKGFQNLEFTGGMEPEPGARPQGQDAAPAFAGSGQPLGGAAQQPAAAPGPQPSAPPAAQFTPFSGAGQRLGG